MAKWTNEQRVRVGARIRTARTLREMSTDQLADEMGVTSETVRRHMRGETLTVEALSNYSQVLQVSVDWMLAPATGFEPVTYRSTAQHTQGSAA